ncbi:hypothetical protein Tco_0834484 [Tanacetum coccineum]
MDSTAVKPCQGDPLKFYLIIGNPDGRSYWIKTSQRSVKVKELQERCFIQAFNLKKSMSMLVQKSQVHKTAIISQDDDKRLCLGDGLKGVQVHIQVKLNGTSSSLKSRRPKRKDIEVPQPSGPTDNVADEAVNKEMDGSLVRAATTASSLEAEQDSGSGPKSQNTMGDTIAQTKFKNVSKTSNDSLLVGVNTPRSDEDRLKLNELMEFCTNLQQRVLDLENIKTAQAREITCLKLRVKKLEKKRGSRTHKLKRLYKVGRSARVVSSDEASLGDQEDSSKQGRKIDDIDKDAEITLVHETQGRYGDEEIFDTGVLDSDKVLEEPEVTIKDVNLGVDEVNLAQALAALKYSKRRAFWSLNEDILKITILKTNTSYPSRKIRRIRACTHQRPQRNKDQYAVSRGLNTPYSRYGINIIFWKISSVVPTLRNP